jgi:hypothetical protein
MSDHRERPRHGRISGKSGERGCTPEIQVRCLLPPTALGSALFSHDPFGESKRQPLARRGRRLSLRWSFNFSTTASAAWVRSAIHRAECYVLRGRAMYGRRLRLFQVAAVTGLVALAGFPVSAAAQAPPNNVRVTVDTASSYVSADVMGATGTYSDSTLKRCGVDRRMQNEPTVAIDPRNPAVQTSGSNDYCTVPTNGDAWAGFYRTSDGGSSWTDSLLPGYLLDNSAQGTSSPVHQMALGGAIAAGDPVQSWDGSGRVFYMGNNFNRGTQNGKSVDFRDNTGDVWVATYGPSDPSNSLTDGSRYVRTVILAKNTFGLGSFNDKTAIGVDPANGDVFAAWSEFHGSGCNQIDVSRSVDHGASFSGPMKVSGGLCSNQGPNFAFGPAGQVYLVWQANNGGSKGQHATSFGVAFTSSLNNGQSFSAPRIAVNFVPFVSDDFSGNGARECGDGPFACPTGFTFPRFDLAYPTITTTGNDVDVAFQAKLPSGQGQIQFTKSGNGGANWSTPTAIDPQATGHQFFPWITSSGGRITAIYYDSRSDLTYAPARPPCNDASGATSACLAVWSSTSTDGGATWSHSEVTSALTNPDLEQFGGRLVPFFGDYIEVAAAGSTVEAVWTDQRNAVVGTEISGSDNDGADVAGDPEAGGSCTSSLNACFDAAGGLDQNIYSASLGS